MGRSGHPLRLAISRRLRSGRRACAAARTSSAAETVQRCAAGSRRAIRAQRKGARRGMKWARLMDLPQCYATPMGRHPADVGCPETVNPTGFDAGGVPMLRSRRFEAQFVDKAVPRGLQTATRDHRSKTVDKLQDVRRMSGMGGSSPKSWPKTSPSNTTPVSPIMLSPKDREPQCAYTKLVLSTTKEPWSFLPPPIQLL